MWRGGGSGCEVGLVGRTLLEVCPERWELIFWKAGCWAVWQGVCDSGSCRTSAGQLLAAAGLAEAPLPPHRSGGSRVTPQTPAASQA